MNMISLTCPDCGGSLEVEDSLDMFYCKYCGHKILMANMSKQAYKSRTRIKEFEHKERMQKNNLSQEQLRLKYQERQDRREKISDFFNSDAAKVIIIFGFLFIMATAYPVSSYLQHNSIVSDLKKKESAILQAIQDEDFETATFLNSQLRLVSEWSPGEKKSWDDKRKEYENLIATSKEEYERNNPDNIFMPEGSGYYLGKNVDEIIEMFKNLGFEDVISKESLQKASWFHGVNTVESLLVGGKSDFKKNDYFSKSTHVIIYYYHN